MRILLIILIAFSTPLFGQGQPGNNDSKLAQQYYADGEFEKAGVLYEKLFIKK